MKSTILFLCPHNAAKSVLAAAFCQKLMTTKGLDWQISSAGTDPDANVFPSVIDLLASEGVDVSQEVPRHVTPEDLEGAERIISLGCDVSGITSKEIQIEYWNEVPPPSQALHEARNTIYNHVEKLIDGLN